MNETNSSERNVIKAQTRYFKLLFLQDRENSNNKEVLKRRTRKGIEKGIFDSAICYVYTSYYTARRNDLRFRSTGDVDDVFLVYPDVRSCIKCKEEAEIEVSMNDIACNDVVVVAQYYNAFQKGNESAAARADDCTHNLRLIVDFSSIVTARGKENQLFMNEPKANSEEHVRSIGGRVFSVEKENVRRDDVLRLEWNINWDNLAVWKCEYKNEGIIPIQATIGGSID
jgi:hypothetical protein